MRHRVLKTLDYFIRIGLFIIALVLVIGFIIAIDEFVVKQRLYFLRVGDWDSLITVSVFAVLMGYILKKLLIMQFRWGVKR